MSVKTWTIMYDNDTGPNDEGFSEWWSVTDGDREFRVNNEGDANWLCGFLNSNDTQG